MLKILHVAHSLLPEGNTSVEHYTNDITRAQARDSNAAVVIYARGIRTDVAAEKEEREEVDGVARLRVHFGTRSQSAFRRTRPEMAGLFRSFVEEWKPDIVHFQHLLYHSLDYARIAKASGAATVMTLHDLWLACPTMQRVDYQGALCRRDPGRPCLPCTASDGGTDKSSGQKMARYAKSPLAAPFLELMPITREFTTWTKDSQTCLNSVDTVVSPSRFVRDNLVEHGLLHPRVTFLPIGVAKPSSAAIPGIRTRETDGQIRFGLIGSHRLKGIETAIAAFASLSSLPNIRLLWYGMNANAVSTALPESVEIPSNVTVSGRYTEADIERVYDSFDVLIVPSLWWECAPVVIREAFARGKPVIGSRIGGITEAIRDGVDGFLFPPGDPRALADSIRRISLTPKMLDRLREGILPQKFFDEHVHDLSALYQETLRSVESTRPRQKL